MAIREHTIEGQTFTLNTRYSFAVVIVRPIGTTGLYFAEAVAHTDNLAKAIKLAMRRAKKFKKPAKPAEEKE